jgi:hypothetical protein
MFNKIKIISLVILILSLTNSVSGQQFLWSTVKTDSVSGRKYVPINNITKEVITFYDQYDYYFDLSGYSKKRFIEEINYGYDDWSWLYEIKELSVYALKSNTGKGSIIMVLCVSKDNVNLLLFSSDIIAHKNPQSTSQYQKEKFIKWFKTLLN